MDRSIWKKFTPLFLILPMVIFAQDNLPLEEEEIEAFKGWIATKRMVTVRERGGNLSISGEARVEYIAANERRNGLKNIGANSRNPTIANDQFDIEF